MQVVQGFLFGLGQSQACEWIDKLSRILNQALGYEKQLPERNPARLETVLRECPSLEFLIDGTQRPINRPDKQRNREIAQERVEIEHHLSGIKRCNILVHPLRNRTDYFVDEVMETACGLHNFRLTHRQLKVV